jgi:hypothetical protein
MTQNPRSGQRFLQPQVSEAISIPHYEGVFDCWESLCGTDPMLV